MLMLALFEDFGLKLAIVTVHSTKYDHQYYHFVELQLSTNSYILITSR